MTALNQPVNSQARMANKIPVSSLQAVPPAMFERRVEKHISLIGLTMAHQLFNLTIQLHNSLYIQRAETT